MVGFEVVLYWWVFLEVGFVDFLFVGLLLCCRVWFVVYCWLVCGGFVGLLQIVVRFWAGGMFDCFVCLVGRLWLLVDLLLFYYLVFAC